MSNKSFRGYYVGTEFPECLGKEIEIRNDNSDKKYPCYEIRFVGSKEWINNMNDDDFNIKTYHNPNQ